MARTRVYEWQANPAIDLCKFKVSPARAVELLKTDKYHVINLIDGWEALQERIPDDAVIEKIHGGFSCAWQIKPSAGFMVWQMPSQRFGRELR